MTIEDPEAVSALYRLARLHGFDVDLRTRTVASDLLATALRGLGTPITGVAEASKTYNAYRRDVWYWRLEPVTVAWEGIGAAVLRIPADDAHLRIDCNMSLEDGEVHSWGVNLTDVPPFAYEHIEGVDYVAKLLPLRRLPMGYHRMNVDLPGHHTEALVISAPLRAYRNGHSAESPLSLSPPNDASGRPLSPFELRRRGYGPLIAHVRQHLSEGSTAVLSDAADWFMPRYSVGEREQLAVRLRYEVEEIMALLSVESHRHRTSLRAGSSADLPDDISASLERHGIDVVEEEQSVGYPNWRRRIRPTIEEFDDAIVLPDVLETLKRHRP